MHAPSTRRTNRFRKQSLAAAAAAAGGTALAGDASATIIYDISSTTDASTFPLLQLDGTDFGSVEVRYEAGMMGNTNLSLDSPNGGMMGTNSTLEFVAFDQGGTDYLQVLPYLQTHDGTQGYTFVGRAFLDRNGTSHPTWAQGDPTPQYVGFRFDPGGSGTTVYGWFRMTYDSASNATIDQWAWEDSGAGIAIGAIPEPGTALLGEAGRRRRRAARGAQPGS